MEISYDDIKDDFEEIRNYISYDLELLSGQEKGGNYITAFLIACACETLARFRWGTNKGEQFFADKMLPARWRTVAPSLFSAMRDGIAHGFKTKSIRIGNRLLDVGIAWREKPHLQFSPDKCIVYLNIQTMSQQIFNVLKEYEHELKADPKLRLQFQRGVKTKWKQKIGAKELQAWNKLLAQGLDSIE